jgi:hypothetical protein
MLLTLGRTSSTQTRCETHSRFRTWEALRERTDIIRHMDIRHFRRRFRVDGPALFSPRLSQIESERNR